MVRHSCPAKILILLTVFCTGLRHNVTDSKPTTPPPRSYTAELLLALRPNAIESMKERVRASCPEIVMSRRVRKAVEYHERQYTKIQRSNDPVSQEDRHPIVIDKHAHLPLSVSSELPRTRAPRDAPAQTHVPRSSNPPERRRNAPQSFYTPGATRTWRGMDVSSLTPLRLTLG